MRIIDVTKLFVLFLFFFTLHWMSWDITWHLIRYDVHWQSPKRENGDGFRDYLKGGLNNPSGLRTYYPSRKKTAQYGYYKCGSDLYSFRSRFEIIGIQTNINIKNLIKYIMGNSSKMGNRFILTKIFAAIFNCNVLPWASWQPEQNKWKYNELHYWKCEFLIMEWRQHLWKEIEFFLS